MNVPHRREITVAALQVSTTHSVVDNIALVDDALRELANQQDGLDLVVLPEMLTYRPLGDHPTEDIAQPARGELCAMFSAHARNLGANLVAGSFIARHSDGKIRNTSLTFDRAGHIAAEYHKTHLFDAPGHDESSHVVAGDEFCVVESDIGVFAVQICYELRFPEIARTLCAAGAEILVVPNSWPSSGPARADRDLDLLLRATAVQAQCYIVHANQEGHVGGLDLCGLSGVYGPSGEPVRVAPSGPSWTVAMIDLAEVATKRAQRPTLTQRRPSLYDPTHVRRNLALEH